MSASLRAAIVLLLLASLGQETGFGQLIYDTPYTFVTIAGNPPNAIGGITNVSARFNSPEGIAADKGGNLFMADTANNTIRRIRPIILSGQTNWLVSTIAGSAGASGSADGIGSAARFNSPTGLNLDSAGNLYVADSGNSVIRKIAPGVSGGQTNWVVTTIAGTAGIHGNADGIGSDVLFYAPEGVVVDGAGNLYVADTFNNTIRKISPTILSGVTNWVVSTIAGSGSAGSSDGTGTDALFHFPLGIAADSAGNLYVSDSANYTIRQLSAMVSAGQTNWVVSTIAGTADSSGSADGSGVAARFGYPAEISAAPGGALYVADSLNSTIRQLSPVVSNGETNWFVSTIAGSAGLNGTADGTGTSARFAGAFAVGVNVAGNLYVADTSNNTIRQLSLTPTGGQTNWIVLTIAGIPERQGSEDGLGIGGEAPFSGPMGIVSDQAANLFFSDSGNRIIRKLTPTVSAGQTNWIVSTIAGLAGRGGSSDGAGNDAGFNSPTGIAIDAGGALYVLDNFAIRRIALTVSAGQSNWAVTTIVGLPGHAGATDGTNSAARFRAAGQVALDGAGNLYVPDSGNYTIRKVSSIVSSGQTNWVTTTIAGLAGSSGTADGTNSVARFSFPRGIAVDKARDLYVTDLQTIRQLRPFVSAGQTNWEVTTIAGFPGPGNFCPMDGSGASASFHGPDGIVVDDATNLFVVDSDAGLIRKLTNTISAGDENWTSITLAGSPFSSSSSDGTGPNVGFSLPKGLAMDNSAKLYVADYAHDSIRMGWLAPSVPGILLSSPIFSGDQVQINFVITYGWASSFELLEANALAGSWSVNTSAILTINAQGVSYTFTAPYLGGAAHFYRVRAH